MSKSDLGTAPPKGFRDFLPQETELRDRVLNSILSVYRSYGFERVETPAIEDLRRLQKSEGGENLGLMFRILKRGDKLDLNKPNINAEDLVDLGLRYDLTVPLSRYYANNRNSLPAVFKALQVGPVWRAERPQAGRFRQFVQCDIDVIGGTAPTVEVELITATQAALASIGIKGIQVKINDRRILSAMITQAGILEDRATKALIILDKQDKIGLDGISQELLTSGFEQTAITKLLTLVSGIKNLAPENCLHGAAVALADSVEPLVFKQLEEIIAAASSNILAENSITFDPFLVRGMGYYTGTVFEISHPNFGSSIAGGGRYDKLIGNLSGIDATACGFSIGFERIINILLEQQVMSQNKNAKLAIFFDCGNENLIAAMQVANQFREQGKVATIFESPKNLKAALEKLKGSGYTGFGRLRPGEQLVVKEL